MIENSEVSYSDKFNKQAKFNHLMLSMSGDAELAGLQSLNNVAKENKPEHRRQKKKEKQYRDFLQLLTETQIKLQDFIEEIDLKLLQARQDLKQHKELFAERIALEHCIDVLANDGLLERNADGSLKDKDLERAVTLYLKNNNMSVELSDDARIYAIAQNLITTYPTQDQLSNVIDLDNQIIDTLRGGKDQAQILQDKLNDPDKLSNNDLLQIGKQTDALVVKVNKDYSSFLDKRAEILDSVTTANNQTNHIILQQNSIQDLEGMTDKQTASLSIPQPDLNL